MTISILSLRSYDEVQGGNAEEWRVLGCLSQKSKQAVWMTETHRSMISFCYREFMEPISFVFIKYINKEWDWRVYLQ